MKKITMFIVLLGTFSSCTNNINTESITETIIEDTTTIDTTITPVILVLDTVGKDSI